MLCELSITRIKAFFSSSFALYTCWRSRPLRYFTQWIEILTAGLLIIGLKMANQISMQPTKHLKVSDSDTLNIREQSTTSMELPSSSRYNKPFNDYERIDFVKIQSQYLFDYNITSKLWIVPPFRMAACGLCSHRGDGYDFWVNRMPYPWWSKYHVRKVKSQHSKNFFLMTSNKIVHNFQQNTPQFNTAEQELSAMMSFANEIFAKNAIPMDQSPMCERQV